MLNRSVYLFNDQCSHHIETSQLICRANQLTGFYMMGTLVVKGLMQIWIPEIRIYKCLIITSAIRQKGESQNGCYKKTKHAKVFEKRTFRTPWYAHARVRTWSKKCLFFGEFGVLCFLLTSVLRFTLLRCYRRYMVRMIHVWHANIYTSCEY